MAISDNIDGSSTSYTATFSDFTSGSICGSATIPASSCQNGVCRHMFEVSPPCSSNVDVSINVYATNILGDGPSSHPVVFNLIIPGPVSYTHLTLPTNREV